MTLHDCMPFHFPAYLGRNPLRRLGYHRALRFLHRCAGVVTDSHASKSDIVRFCGVAPEKIHVVYCWAGGGFSRARAAELSPKVRKKYSLPERYWLYLGGYDVRKNVGLLLEAYAAVRKVPGCPPLVLAGRIPTTRHATLCDVAGDLKRLALVGNGVVTPGFIADEDLAGLYGGADLFIYPSRGEGFGLPPLEAVSCGCPAVVGDNTSLREVIPDATHRFDTSDPHLLVEIFKRAAANPFPMNPPPNQFSFSLSMARLSAALGFAQNPPCDDGEAGFRLAKDRATKLI